VNSNISLSLTQFLQPISAQFEKVAVIMHDVPMDATQGFMGAHRRKNLTLTVSGMSDNERSESMVDRKSENS